MRPGGSSNQTTNYVILSSLISKVSLSRDSLNRLYLRVTCYPRMILCACQAAWTVQTVLAQIRRSAPLMQMFTTYPRAPLRRYNIVSVHSQHRKTLSSKTKPAKNTKPSLRVSMSTLRSHAGLPWLQFWITCACGNRRMRKSQTRN